ncbi:MAG TPA: HNH endonuclease signature motif containing protein [Xanthobacteraceae bacterium]|jgi:hypothetical protein
MARQNDNMKNAEPKRPSVRKRPRRRSDLTAARLRQLLDYSPETGRFHWRESRGGLTAAMEAGTGKNGYRTIHVDGLIHYAHRLAWLYVYGRHPADQIDHINRNRADNRIANLRETSQQENLWNSVRPSASGVKGVRHRGHNWYARITRDGEEIHLGSYDTREEAEAAFQGAAIARQFLFDMARRRSARNRRKLTESAPGAPTGRNIRDSNA